MSILQSSVYISFRASSFLGDRRPADVCQTELNALVIERLTGGVLGARITKPLSDIQQRFFDQNEADATFPVIGTSESDDRRNLSDLLGKTEDADVLLSLEGVEGVLPLTIAASKANGIFFSDTSDLIVIASRQFVSPVGARFLHSQAFTDFVAQNGALSCWMAMRLLLL